MHSYKYSVSLRIRHPERDPSGFTNELGLEPHTAQRAGDARKTPAGEPLSGSYRESYWCCRATNPDPADSDEVSLEECILNLNSELSEHRGYFQELTESGGYIEYFVGIFGSLQIGLELSRDLLEETAELGIGLGLDIYGNGHEAT